MSGINYWAVVVSVLIAFVVSAIYYIILNKERAKVSPAAASGGNRPKPTQMFAELVRSFILAWVVAYLVGHLGITTLIDSGELALMLWVAFPVILLSGSVMYEKVPAKLAVIHSGDWIIKLLIMTAILGSWR